MLICKEHKAVLLDQESKTHYAVLWNGRGSHHNGSLYTKIQLLEVSHKLPRRPVVVLTVFFITAGFAANSSGNLFIEMDVHTIPGGAVHRLRLVTNKELLTVIVSLGGDGTTRRANNVNRTVRLCSKSKGGDEESGQSENHKKKSDKLFH